ncbi:hypothetical protein NFI96_001556 [Prochilodus magdalenae]|nr:hypothetical protein NFI96_001556 [Prochilodus magdalenae]
MIMGFLLNQSGHLHSHAHSHGHGHTHSPQPAQGQHGHQGHGSLAVRAAFIHALGDLVQSIGVLIAAYIVRFKPEYKLADPVCTYVFSVLVLVTTFRIIRDTGLILLEGEFSLRAFPCSLGVPLLSDRRSVEESSHGGAPVEVLKSEAGVELDVLLSLRHEGVPRHLDVSVMKADLLKLENVEEVEELKLWALTGDKTAAIAHLQLMPGSVGAWEEVQAKARHVLMKSHGVSHCTVQLQSRRQGAPHTCSNCLLSA